MMETSEIKAILQNPYRREDWFRILNFLQGKRNLLTRRLEPEAITVANASDLNLIKSFVDLGKFVTSDGIELPIFEVILNENIRIERNRVGVNEFIKNYIIKGAIRGALVTFSYENNELKPEWRFSFISKNSASEFFEEAESEETNPKKFTYIFGNKEQHRTSIERLNNLEQSRFTLDDFFETFNVAPISEEFFKEYGKFHRDFCDFLSQNESYNRIFRDSDNPLTDQEKEIRNFVNRLMGRLVFLYFLQKKNWLGATSNEYNEALHPKFLSYLFDSDEVRQDNFYREYLCPIFFNALNTSRENDVFQLANGEKVCIPYLNGGLFEEHQEPKGHREIQFPSYLFKGLFDFLNSYNFTVYENSPEEHTMAVDPEMLGHIFENLIDYNKDTGAFYTPKEIVQYMTRESLIEYLHTHLKRNREEISQLVRNQNASLFSEMEFNEIDHLLNQVKVCDPAVGSGAYPMGMLMEIFNLKALINFHLNKDDWNPVEAKRSIIYNSIYGVDIDDGAVEIARLRFWLSFIVDEDKPRALPNLDYRIMQGNSIVESFHGIDLKNLGKVDEPVLTGQGVLNFGEEHTGITVFDYVKLGHIQQLIGEYFEANSQGKRNKQELKKEIDDIIEGKIRSRISGERRRLQKQKRDFYKKYNLPENASLTEFNPKSKDIKDLEQVQKALDQLEESEKELISFQEKSERPYFLWHLFFSDVLDDGGFDIVIGNPPYIKEYTNRSAFDEFRDMSDYYQGKMDLWYGFASVGLDLLKEKGVECFIAQNNWVTSAGAGSLRKNVLERTEIKQFLDFGDYKVFNSAGIQTMIYLLQKTKQPKDEYEVYYAGLNKNNINKAQLVSFLDPYKKKSEEKIFEKYPQKFRPREYQGKFISFIKPSVNSILKVINDRGNYKLRNDKVAQGIVAPQDKLNSKGLKRLGKNFKLNQGIFVLNSEEKAAIDFSDSELKIIQPYYTTRELERYVAEEENTEWIIYTSSDFNSLIKDFPKIKVHLDQFKDIITSSNGPYGLHRPRNPYFFKGEKIISLRKCGVPTFTYTDFDCYVSQTFFIIKEENINLKYLTTFLNSKIAYYWLRYKGKRLGDLFQVDKEPLLKIPVYKPESYFPFLELFELISATLKAEQRIMEVIQNKHIAQFFEEVVDACFFDVYFPEEMKEKGISVIEEVSGDLRNFDIEDNFEDLGFEEKEKKITKLYMGWKSSQVQQKMRKFVTSSPDILKPIIQS